MKKVLIAVQLVLLGLFLYNTGIIGIFKHLPFEKGEPLIVENNRILWKFVADKLELAKKKGADYSPECYFSDYAEIIQKKKQLPGSNVDLGSINEMMSVSLANVHRGRWSYHDIDVARDKYKKVFDPNWTEHDRIEKEMAQKGYWPKTGKKILFGLLSWLLIFYLKNLPLAFVLLLIWWQKEYRTFRVKNPFSFAITVLIYPYAISKVFYRIFKEGYFFYSAEVELRQTKKKFFTLLSQDEIAEIRRFAKSRFGRKVLRRRLSWQGAEIRRSFGSALLATLLLSFISANVQAETLPQKDASHDSAVIIHASPPDSPAFNTGGSDYGSSFFESIEAVATAGLELFTGSGQRICREIFSLLPNPPRKIEHVPVVG